VKLQGDHWAKTLLGTKRQQLNILPVDQVLVLVVGQPVLIAYHDWWLTVIPVGALATGHLIPYSLLRVKNMKNFAE
jgi:uncharacterized membrane protein (DUF485 family)